jgi:hypothetical protein
VEDEEYEDRLHCVGPEPALGKEVTLELSNEDDETQWEVRIAFPTPTNEEGDVDDGDTTPSPSATPGDQDGDGINDSEHGCPSEYGPAGNNGCPDPDSDAMGSLIVRMPALLSLVLLKTVVVHSLMPISLGTSRGRLL